jgi:hypothetical protein
MSLRGVCDNGLDKRGLMRAVNLKLNSPSPGMLNGISGKFAHCFTEGLASGILQVDQSSQQSCSLSGGFDIAFVVKWKVCDLPQHRFSIPGRGILIGVGVPLGDNSSHSVELR